jgi:hypothetical protein
MEKKLQETDPKFINVKEVKAFDKYIKKDAVLIPTLVDSKHNKAIEDQDKANMLSSFSSKCFNIHHSLHCSTRICHLSPTINSAPDSSDGRTNSSNDNLNELLCTEDHVIRLLQSINVKGYRQNFSP